MDFNNLFELESERKARDFMGADNMGKLLALEKKVRDAIVSDNIISLINYDTDVGTKFFKDGYIYYSRIFGLCKTLGITNIYDIGGRNWQPSFLLIDSPDINYTGIDCHDIDYEYLNGVFEEHKNIKFQKAYYPFDIMAAGNNIAVSHYAMGTLLTEEESIKIAAAALSKDFERILINIKREWLHIWETGLAEFRLYTVDCKGDAKERPLVLGTKFPEEIDKLKHIEYDYLNDEFAVKI